MPKADRVTNEQPPCLPRPLPPLLMVDEEGSFAHRTVTIRLPGILDRVVAENDFPPAIVEDLQALIEELPDGRVRPIREDGGPDLAAWAGYVEPFVGQRWLDIPWYFAEAYFYRRVLEATQYFSSGPWRDVDPFEAQKRRGLASAMPSVRTLSSRVNELVRGDDGGDRAGFATLTYFGLWGNRADMSIWPVDEEGDDRSHVEVEGERVNIVVNDAPALAGKLAGFQAVRVDFIMDNAGFELFCDLCLADFLLTSGSADTVCLHLKAHPTFVSDAMIRDVNSALEILTADEDSEVRKLARRLQRNVDDGRLRLHEHLFWTSPLAFWEMPSDLRDGLKWTAVVFVKGDANYRRLLGDRHWAFTTPFEDIVCYFPSPLVALRTFKSEVAAGLQPGQIEKLDREDPDWLTNGRRGVIQLVDE